MTYDAVLFDNDGVLVTLVEQEVLRRAAAETFATLDVDPRPDHVDEMTVGVTPDALQRVCETYDLDPTEFFSLRDRHSSQRQQAEIRAGRKTLYDDFDAVQRLEHPLGIVSSNQQETVDFLLDHFDVGHLFETAYGREPTPESLHRKKPNTYYLEQALADLEADTALYVGDSETDLLAAHAAGLDSAFIRRPHRADADLDTAPTYEIDSLDAIPELVTSR
ncbi:haloacid dehalogenase superfamily, subfamily IA, variant 1 with third motif having Dx(3-4)D or Dx(3-4)E [Halogranum amylolyticum]|uniref:Haloacid dehalogenase superfamily, subfamily IA, variant 1 with third motif having Dx(3-4)D or Dx(3-4)E n=1 Tax=Halogranum amylolyticum TaxID=660520 RepID=A0A1H8NJ34_9EURY|nr:HAD family hydrolase [Halogranum amylolyticum]SEO29393.1 haloacid dehalogenase superfamily, subfamily IA, variant 1 with third motif having Dx(3-4)D or Dx(3-4)E [Halogranum amylolyticum]